MDLYISLQTSSRIPGLDPVTRYLSLASLTYLFPCIHVMHEVRSRCVKQGSGALILNIYRHRGVKWDVWMSTSLIRISSHSNVRRITMTDPPSNAPNLNSEENPPRRQWFRGESICRLSEVVLKKMTSAGYSEAMVGRLRSE